MKKIIGAVLCIMILGSCAVTRPITREDYRKVSGANYCAVIFPGLSQLLAKEYKEAAFIFAATVIPAGVSSLFAAPDGGPRAGSEVWYGLCALATVGGYSWNVADGIYTTKELIKQRETIDREIFVEGIRASTTLTEVEKAAILDGKIFTGMSEGAALIILGKPSDINSTVVSGGIHKQLVYRSTYGKTRYVYIENGKVTGWQNF